MEKAHKHSMKKFRRAKVDLNQLDEEAALTLDETTSSMSGSQRWSRSTLNGDWPRGQHGEYVYGGQEYGGRYEEADHIYDAPQYDLHRAFMSGAIPPHYVPRQSPPPVNLMTPAFDTSGTSYQPWHPHSPLQPEVSTDYDHTSGSDGYNYNNRGYANPSYTAEDLYSQTDPYYPYEAPDWQRDQPAKEPRRHAHGDAQAQASDASRSRRGSRRPSPHSGHDPDVEHSTRSSSQMSRGQSVDAKRRKVKSAKEVIPDIITVETHRRSVRGRDRDNRSQGTKRESDDREARSSSRRPRPAHHRSPSRSDSSRKHRRPDYPRTPSVPTGPPPRAPSPPYRSQGNHPPPALSDISSPEILLYCDHDSGLGTSVPSTPSQAWASLSRSSSSRRSGSAGSTYTRPSCENEPRTNARTAGKDSDGKKYPPNSSRTKQDKAVGQQKKKSMSGSPCGSRSGSRSGSRDRGTRSSSSCDSAYYSRSASEESERKTRTEAGAYRLS